MTRDEAVAHVRRLCPPGTLEALGRPSGGHALGRVAVEQQSTRLDPRAEPDAAIKSSATDSSLIADEEPTRRERRPSGTTEQVNTVVRAARKSDSVSFAAVHVELAKGKP